MASRAPVAMFASAAAEQVIIEQAVEPVWDHGRQTGVKQGRRHEFHDHRCQIEGQRSIDFVRERAKAPDGPRIWELEATDIAPVNDVLAELAMADVPRIREILKFESDHRANPQIVDLATSLLARMGVSETRPGGAND